MASTATKVDDECTSLVQIKTLIEPVVQLAQMAGESILNVYEQGFSVQQKADDTPVTEADFAANDAIVNGLKQLTPHVPILSEESAAVPYAQRKQWTQYWLVDPLDGTREFIKRNGEFTVNIALIRQGQPILGVVYAPVKEVTYYASRGCGAYKFAQHKIPHLISARPCPKKRLTIAGGHAKQTQIFKRFINGLGNEVNIIKIGSSLKSCLVAEGLADVYPRFGPTAEWDTAAAQCIVEEAGGKITDTLMQPLRYNTKASLLNPHFLVFGDSYKRWSQYLMPLYN